MSVRLHIEEVVVRGLPLTATDRAELAAALAAELGRLLGAWDGGPKWAPGDRPELEARPITYRPGADAGALGRAVAASLVAGLGKLGGGGPDRPDLGKTTQKDG